jgi:chaperonin GroEL
MLARTRFLRGLGQPKALKFGSEARQLLLDGLDKFANAVIVTLGPKGRNALIEQSWGPPKVTKDGASVAKEVLFKDRYHNLAAQLVISVAQKTNDAAGDGTTTATLLTRELYREALKALHSGMDPNELRKGMAIGVDTILKDIQKSSRKVTTQTEIEQVATVSANGNPVIGKLLADAFQAVGKDGVITIQNGKTFEHTLELTKGLKIERGFLSPFFATDPKTHRCEFSNPLILLTDNKITTFAQIQPILQKIAEAGRPLLVVADEVEAEPLAALIVNKLKGVIKVVAIRAPGFGENKLESLQDLATVVGATVISEEMGMKLENATVEQLGSCKSLTVLKDATIIVDGSGPKSGIEQRTSEIRSHIAATESNYEREKLQERLAKILGSVAVINVGGSTETELNEVKDLFEDALSATRAAVEEGIVPGGGAALVRSASSLAGLKGANLEQRAGIEIIMRAATQPAKQIAENAGQSGDVVVSRIAAERSPGFGYDARADTYGDLFERGIVDPAKVVRLALVNAASVASSMTSVDCLIIDEAEFKAPAPPPPPPRQIKQDVDDL